MLKTMVVFADAPAQLGLLVTPTGQGQDDMVVGLRHGITNAIELKVLPFLLDDLLAGFRMILLQPTEQGGPDIKTNFAEIAQFSVWPVAALVNAFVPVGIWARAWLDGDESSQRIFAGGLIKMSVNGEMKRHTRNYSFF